MTPLLFTAVAICLLALIPASVARGKGRSAFGFWLFGLILFLPALIVALIIQPDRDWNRSRRAAASGWQAIGHTPPRHEKSYPLDPLVELERFAQLHASGALSDEEFRKQKERLLALGE